VCAPACCAGNPIKFATDFLAFVTKTFSTSAWIRKLPLETLLLPSPIQLPGLVGNQSMQALLVVSKHASDPNSVEHPDQPVSGSMASWAGSGVPIQVPQTILVGLRLTLLQGARCSHSKNHRLAHTMLS